MNNPGQRIVLRDRGPRACSLTGYPDVQIMDASGRVLASARGMAGRGTFFADWAPIPVLLEPGTGTPSSDVFASQSGLDRGDAFLTLAWYDCAPAHATELALDLPNSGGRLLVPFPVTSPTTAACVGLGPSPSSISRGPLSAAGYASQYTYTHLTDTVSISSPASVRAGSTFVYYVTIEITGPSDYNLSQCPDYAEYLQPKLATQQYQLNCVPVGSIAAGSSATFQMRMTVPSTLTSGSHVLVWALVDDRLTSSVLDQPIHIVSG